MAVNPEVAQERISSVMDRYAGAMKRVTGAYAANRNRERDTYWLALQMTKATKRATLDAVISASPNSTS